MAFTTSRVNHEREQYLCMALVAQEANQFEDMVKIMEKIVVRWTPPTELTAVERKLLFDAYTHVLDELRASYCILSKIGQDTLGSEMMAVMVRMYRSTIENKILEVGDGILKLLDENLLPSASTTEAKVYYTTMEGKFLRYRAELFGIAGRDASLDAEKERAREILVPAPKGFVPLLDFSVFCNEVLCLPTRDCAIANQVNPDPIALRLRTSTDLSTDCVFMASEEAKPLPNLDEKALKESKDLMDSMREKITLRTRKRKQKPEAAQLKDAAAAQLKDAAAAQLKDALLARLAAQLRDAAAVQEKDAATAQEKAAIRMLLAFD